MLSLSSVELDSLINKLNQNTSKFLEVAIECENELTSIEKKMLPIKKSTHSCAQKKKLYETRSNEIERISTYLNTSSSVRPIVETELRKNGFKKQITLFDTLNRLYESKQFLEENRTKLASALTEYEAVSSLFQETVKICLDGLQDLLKTTRVSADSDTYTEEPMLESINTARSVCQHLDMAGVIDHYKVYERCRINVLKNEKSNTKRFKDKGMKQFSSSTSLIKDESNTTTSEVWSVLNSDLPYRRGDSPFQNICQGAISALRMELKIWGNIFSSSSMAASLSYSHVAEYIISSIISGLHPNITTDPSCDALMSSSLLRNVNILLCKLDIINTLISNYDELRELCTTASVGGAEVKDSPALIALNQLRSLLVKGFVQCCNAILKLKWDNEDKVRAGMIKTVQGSLSAGGLNVRGRTEGSGGSCDLHFVTSAVLHCCKGLSSFPSSLYDDLINNLASEMGLKYPPKGSNLQQMIITLIRTLITYIQKLADKLTPGGDNTKRIRTLDMSGHALYGAGESDAMNSLSWAQKHLFLANNYSSLLSYLIERRDDDSLSIDKQRMTRSSGKQRNSAEEEIGDDIESLIVYVEKKLERAKFEFCESVAYALSMSPEDMVAFQAVFHKEAKLGKARVLKAKFSLFNSGMNALESKRGEWRVTSPALREALTTELLQILLPPYSEFFRAHSNVQFSKKHMNEYLLYEPPQVERALANFFEVSRAT